ncbi:MAG: hypothetical protein VR78_06565 [Hoeflea sp. BRH_c9]|nr:MAG: hypothetical protein VR78_06565 [Hoeflea sp. BRH_c9]
MITVGSLSSAKIALADAMPPHVISMMDFDRETILKIFAYADQLRLEQPALRQVHRGQTVATMFFQPSTRTRLNFEGAANALGCSVIGFSDPKTTRAGDFYQESLEDVVKFTGAIADLLVLRHFQTGVSKVAAACSPVPLLNAGDGYNEHPTQALGDLWTMHRLLNGVEGRRIGLIGNPEIRSLRSISLGLARLGAAEVVFLPAPDSCVPEATINELCQHGVGYDIVGNVQELLLRCDVVETIGVRHPDHSKHTDTPVAATTAPDFKLTADLIRRFGPHVWILHPGPRTDELEQDIDGMTNAQYFQQARNGLFVRMALMSALLAAQGK